MAEQRSRFTGRLINAGRGRGGRGWINGRTERSDRRENSNNDIFLLQNEDSEIESLQRYNRRDPSHPSRYVKRDFGPRGREGNFRGRIKGSPDSCDRRGNSRQFKGNIDRDHSHSFKQINEELVPRGREERGFREGNSKSWENERTNSYSRQAKSMDSLYSPYLDDHSYRKEGLQRHRGRPSFQSSIHVNKEFESRYINERRDNRGNSIGGKYGGSVSCDRRENNDNRAFSMGIQNSNGAEHGDYPNHSHPDVSTFMKDLQKHRGIDGISLYRDDNIVYEPKGREGRGGRGGNFRGKNNGRTNSNERKKEINNSAFSLGNPISRGAENVEYLNSTYSDEAIFKRDGLQKHRERENIHTFRDTDSKNEPRDKDGRGGKRSHYKRENPIGKMSLEKLLKMNPDEVIMELLSERSGYQFFLNEEDVRDDKIYDDKMMLLIKVLALASSTTANKQGLNDLLIMTGNKRFMDKVNNLSLRIKMRYSDDASDYFSNLYIFLDIYANIMTSFAIDRIRSVVECCIMILQQLNMKDIVSKELVMKYEGLKDFLECESKKWEIEKEGKTKKNYNLRYEEHDQMLPPDDYRTISVIPTIEDLSPTEKPFLRRNIVQGQYIDSNHYLDVQFRLLREDFVQPLRKGVAAYRKNSKSRNMDVRIYNNVTVIGADIINREMIHYVKLNLPKQLKIENSKRLLYGNLLCFTCDNFKSIAFASVVERGSDTRRKDKPGITDTFMEQNGVIGVKFETDIKDINISKKFLMIESRAYFMAYKHVLKALQDMGNDPVPMEAYVVRVQKENDPPEYLVDDCVYDLRVIKYSNMMKKSEKYSWLTLPRHKQREDVTGTKYSYLKEVHIMQELQYWPSNEDLGLDNSQHRALRTALTSEMAIIQGPPGTGKTFIGLKITQLLLHNSEAWKDPDRPTPILVVCFTNHALDQFLEGITQYTENIVRVGSRTKSENIARFQISELLKQVRRNRKLPGNILDRNNIVYNEVQNLEYEVKSLRSSIKDCRDPKGIVSFDLLRTRKVIPEAFSRQVRGKEGLKRWLLSDEDHNDLTMKMYQLNLDAETAKAASGIILEEELESDDDLWQDAQDLMDMEEQDRRIDTDGEDDMDKEDDVGYLKLTYEITLEEIEKQIKKMLNRYSADETDIEAFWTGKNYEKQYETLKLGLGIKLGTESQLNDLEQYVSQNIHIHNLDMPTRWKLYKHWLNKLAIRVEEKLTVLEAQYQQRVQALKETKDQENLYILRKASIVGMTTTGAAQYNSILKLLAPSIVIIEEAAEILESHVITSMTSKCKHLIMIGDHQQLKPSATVYELAKKYDLETSLFERMVKNQIKYETLEYQHRMRPMISKLLVPSIYKELKDHPSVHDYPSVQGVTKDVFFISHQILEREEADDNNSHENSHEAELLIALCRHLVLQGYDPLDITILTPYSGQFFLLRKIQRQHAVCQGVRISVVDNFQGEENKIILLSLVRSNQDGKAGFLKIDNRVCVALSRAKHGLFITGNISMLEGSSKLWQQVKSDLENENCIASTLTLCCKNHPDQLTSIKTGKDILDKSPEGGCLLPCTGILASCGHECVKTCHLRDMNHENIKCNIPCPRTLCEDDHPCPKKCWEKCSPCQVIVYRLLPCGHMHDIMCHIDEEKFSCPTLVEKTLHDCQHKVEIPCHIDPANYRCNTPCDTRLDCGHKCRYDCHIKRDPDHLEYKCFEICAKLNKGCSQNHECQRKCYEECGHCVMKVKKIAPCGHEHKNIECPIPESYIECKKKCKKILSCGHPCPKKCNEDCGGCMDKIKKTVQTCGHEITIECHKEPDKKYCKQKCPLSLSCGHQCQSRCDQICTSQCPIPVPTSSICPHKHQIQLPCHLSKEVKGESAWEYCDAPCNNMLECEHQCRGSCGKCLHGRLHQSCNEPCERQLVCGHMCQQSCSSDCPPCQTSCDWKCIHSKCRKRCGVICEPCKQLCTWSCQHHRCNNRCGETCSRPPCMETCPLQLKCGHPCVGFCGDPCPPLCRICDRSELIDEFMLIGNEDDHDARFVLLEDCGHCIESEGLEGWLMQEKEEIGMLACPRCKKTIYNNRRYQDIVLKAYKDVKQVKNQYYQTSHRVQRKEVELIIQDVQLIRDFLTEVEQLTQILGVGQFNKSHGKPKQRNLSDNELKLIKFQAQILKKASSILKNFREQEREDSIANGKGHKSKKISKEEQNTYESLKVVLKTVMSQKLVIAPQMVHEADCELQRITILPSLWKLEGKAANNPIQKIIRIVAKIQIVLDPTLVFEEEKEQTVRDLLKKGEKYVGNLGISDKERKMIIDAMGLRQGHWFKCGNGHVYCITECGGAMEESKCPECDSVIGGKNHTLTSQNALASEMDGAKHAAWSDHTNNMANFDINEL